VKKRAFTLIELLVVIAIIALLLAILLPSLSKVKQIARDVVCRTNLKQWSLIWAMYTNEHNGKFPHSISGSGNARGDWINTLRDEWNTNGDIVKCPTAPKYKDFGASNPHGSYTSTYKIDGGSQEECSYGLNTWTYTERPDGSRRGFPGDNNDFWRKISVRSSSNTIPMFMDSMWRGGNPGYTSGDEISMPDDPSETNNWGDKKHAGGMRQFAMPRHGSGAKAGTNVLFFDLSARHVRIKGMWKLKWHRSFDTRGYTQVTGNAWPTWMDKYVEN
jgi:prepilin-type N-terminal cleavage/methylation domain-containing protein